MWKVWRIIRSILEGLLYFWTSISSYQQRYCYYWINIITMVYHNYFRLVVRLMCAMIVVVGCWIRTWLPLERRCRYYLILFLRTLRFYKTSVMLVYIYSYRAFSLPSPAPSTFSDICRLAWYFCALFGRLLCWMKHDIQWKFDWTCWTG